MACPCGDRRSRSRMACGWQSVRVAAKAGVATTLSTATMVAMKTPRIWIFPLVLGRSGDGRKRAAQFGASGARARPECGNAASRPRLFAHGVRVFRVLVQVIV